VNALEQIIAENQDCQRAASVFALARRASREDQVVPSGVLLAQLRGVTTLSLARRANGSGQR